MCLAGETYDQATMFDHYDDEGFDAYGYSAFDATGQFVGCGRGVDRAGMTENDYMLQHDHYDDFE